MKIKNTDKLFFTLRITLGWLFFYAGLVKVMNPNWSAAGYLNSAKSLGFFYQWLASPDIIPIINFVNEWGLLLLGVSLLVGLFVRLSSTLGVALMALYYIPILSFPIVGEHYFLVDEHVIFAIALLLLANVRAGRIWGLETWCSKLPICAKYPKLRKMIG